MASGSSRKTSSELVVFFADEEVAIGPLISEKDLIKYFFTDAGRDISRFERAVVPYSGDMDGLVAAAKEILKERKEVYDEDSDGSIRTPSAC